VAHFREISSDRWSRVSLIRKASSSAAENVMAIVLAYFQSVCQDQRQSTYDVKRLWVFQPGSGSVGAIAIASESLVGRTSNRTVCHCNIVLESSKTKGHDGRIGSQCNRSTRERLHWDDAMIIQLVWVN
jgi:hypothetical protein